MSKISSKEVFVFCFCLCSFMFPGFAYNVMFNTSKNASIIASLVGFIIGFIPIFICLYLSKFLNKQNIFEFNKQKFGVMGTIFNLLLVLCAILICFISSWVMINFVISQFLTRTSYYAFAICFFLIIGYCASKGLEVMGRCNLVLFFLFVLVFIFCVIFLSPLIEVDNFFPMFDCSLFDFSKGSMVYTSLSAIPIFIILAIKRDNVSDNHNYKKSIILAYVCGAILLIGFLVFILGILGIDITYVLAYPEYTVFKKIKAFNFIERVENIVAILIFISFFGAFSFLLYFIREWFNSCFKVKKKRITTIFIYVVSLLIPILSIMFFKGQHSHYIYTYFPLVMGFMFLLFFIIFILCLVSKKVK